MPESTEIALVCRVDGRSDFVIDDTGIQIAFHSIAFEAVNGKVVALGFGNEGLSQLILLLQKLLAGTLDHHLGT